MNALEQATTDELVRELTRRHDAVVIGLWKVRFRGQSYIRGLVWGEPAAGFGLASYLKHRALHHMDKLRICEDDQEDESDSPPSEPEHE